MDSTHAPPISKNKAMNIHTYWNINTGPETPERLALVEPSFEPAKNLRDPEKIAANIAEKRADWIANAALDPLCGRVLEIGYQCGDEQVIQHVAQPGVTESELIAAFFGVVETAMTCGDRYVGFNIRSFDIPFLVKRAWILGLKVPSALRPNGQSYWRAPETFIDLRDIWTMNDRHAHGSLNTLGKLFGLGEKTDDGKNFATLFWNESTREQALAYDASNLRLCAKLAERLLG